MKYVKLGLIPLVILAIIFIQSLYFKESKADNDTPSPPPITSSSLSFVVNANPSLALTQRIGVNISTWSSSGAEQYMKNIIQNPGFEGVIDRIIVLVNHFDEHSFSDEQGSGLPDNHFDGATYEVRTGPSAGATGTLSRSLKEGAEGLPQYFPEGLMPALQLNDVIVISKEFKPHPPGKWSVPQEALPLVQLEDSSPPSGSQGEFAIALAPTAETPAQIHYEADTLTERAGKLLMVNGPWKLSFWVRAEGEKPSLQVRFARLNETAPFIERTLQPTSEWQKMDWDFTGEDAGAPASLQLAFKASQPDTRLFIKDVFLGPIQNQHPQLAWRQEVVDLLRELKPSWLRDWQGQLCDTFRNRIAETYQRKTYRYREYGGEGEIHFGYSIPEFLDLCREVQATPWLIIPTALNDSELTQFGEFLAQQADKSQFAEIILEFGSDSWNMQKRPGTIPVPQSYGAIASRAFEQIAAAAGPNVQLRRVINGPYTDPELALQLANSIKNYDVLSISPYFFDSMTLASSQADQLNALFSDKSSYFRQIKDLLLPLNKTLAVCEVNLNTRGGNATAATREPLVAGMVSGSALAKTLLEGLFFDASPQVVYCFSKYDTPLLDNEGHVKLWGITRDLSPTQRLRPTGLAVKMLNEILGGSLHHINPKPLPSDIGNAVIPPEVHKLTMASFRTLEQWSTAIVSTHSEPLEVTIEFPDDGKALPDYGEELAARDPFATNEITEEVKIVRQPISVDGRKVRVTVPAYGFIILHADSSTPIPPTDPTAYDR
jgi:hypothetical protein